MNKVSGIYKIESKVHPDRIYIGRGVNVVARIWDHKTRLKAQCHKNPKLQAHYNKYGMDDLVFSKVEECDQDMLIEREQYYIDTLCPWFNIEKCSYNSFGRECRPETRKKIGDSNRGKKRTTEVKQKLREANLRTDRKGKNNPMYGRKHTEEEKENLRIKSTGRVVSDETRLKLSVANTGRCVSDETRLKISIANKGKKRTPEQREMMRLTGKQRHKDHPMSQESIDKTAAKNTGRKNTAESNLKISVARKAFLASLKERTWETIFGVEAATKMREDRKRKYAEINKNKL